MTTVVFSLHWPASVKCIVLVTIAGPELNPHEKPLPSTLSTAST